MLVREVSRTYRNGTYGTHFFLQPTQEVRDALNNVCKMLEHRERISGRDNHLLTDTPLACAWKGGILAGRETLCAIAVQNGFGPIGSDELLSGELFMFHKNIFVNKAQEELGLSKDVNEWGLREHAFLGAFVRITGALFFHSRTFIVGCPAYVYIYSPPATAL